MMTSRKFQFALLVGFMLAPALVSLAVEKIDYNRDIRPILSENCFSCHGFDEKARKAKLRLDQSESAYEDRKGITAIKPGDLKESAVWERVISEDEDEVMPPPKSHLKLTVSDKAKIRSWIEQGGKYAGHWSFIPPQKSAIPADAKNAIDGFVRQRLEKDGLHPSKEADRVTLIRRLWFDLIGLPPSAAEVASFVNDKSPDAYEKQVDRLLADEHFGERMALEWLDAARYADTNGYSIDGGRNAWLWRDYVIQSFNDNKHYDQFIVEQLAGDLLPKPSDSQIIATGFQRNNMVTHEGGTIAAENLTNYNIDRVKTLGESVLGLTLACAQCHNHKFDPITQKDYYQMYAFFNTLGDRPNDGDRGVSPTPTFEMRTVLKTAEARELQKQIGLLQNRLTTPDLKIQSSWEQREKAILATRGQNLKLLPLKLIKISTPNRGSGFELEGESRVRLKQAGNFAAFDISGELPKTNEPITGIRMVVHPQKELPGGGWGFGSIAGKPAPKPRAKAAAKPAVKSPPSTKPGGPVKPVAPATPPAPVQPEIKGSFMLTAIAATADTVPSDQVNLFKLLAIGRVTANSWDATHPPEGCLDPRPETGWAPDVATEGPVHLTATFAAPIHADATPYFTVQLNYGFGQDMVPGLIELQAVTGLDDGTTLPDDVLLAIKTQADKRTAEMHASLWKHCANYCDELHRTRIDLANLQERLAVITKSYPAMVMNVADKPRDTFILNRGDYAQPTVKVSAATPAALPAMPNGSAMNRLGLANWIVMRDNPLPARVAVNRFWKMIFGSGIVATPADFGSQGEWPSHPELLDWLAVDFVEHDWDVKRLLRQIVMSETYRQSSITSPELLEKDPQNRLLARGPRFRLSAELIRDNALKISGLYVDRIGGPSVNPYTPGDLWREVSHYGSTHATSQTFVQDHGEKLYRRSLYTYWKRTAPPPNMTAFDAPNREVCTASRGNTTTPLQALVTLNDPQYVEASRAFAERILSQKGDDASKLSWAMQEAISRVPNEKELKVLKRALDRERQIFVTHPEKATAVLKVGESQRDENIAAGEHAAWMQVASMILNLSETVTLN